MYDDISSANLLRMGLTYHLHTPPLYNTSCVLINNQSTIWRQADNHIQLLDNPENQGWKLDSFGSYRAVGFTNLVAPKDILELVKCGCTTGCHGNRCRCSKNKLPCTGMCECQSCENREKECFVVGDGDDDIDEKDVDC